MRRPNARRLDPSRRRRLVNRQSAHRCIAVDHPPLRQCPEWVAKRTDDSCPRIARSQCLRIALLHVEAARPARRSIARQHSFHICPITVRRNSAYESARPSCTRPAHASLQTIEGHQQSARSIMGACTTDALGRSCMHCILGSSASLRTTPVCDSSRPRFPQRSPGTGASSSQAPNTRAARDPRPGAEVERFAKDRYAAFEGVGRFPRDDGIEAAARIKVVAAGELVVGPAGGPAHDIHPTARHGLGLPLSMNITVPRTTRSNNPSMRTSSGGRCEC